MQAHLVSTKQAEQETPEQLFEEVVSSAQGLSSEDARRRLEQYGPNALEEEKINPLLKFLTYFWGPIP